MSLLRQSSILLLATGVLVAVELAETIRRGDALVSAIGGFTLGLVSAAVLVERLVYRRRK